MINNPINLKERIGNRAKSQTHLENHNFQDFVQFCEPHQQIAALFGSSRICKKSAMLCKSNCKKHKQEDAKHSTISIQMLIQAIKQLKNKYIEFHQVYVKKMIPTFLERLQNFVIDFMEGLEMFNSETLLVSDLTSFYRNQKIQSLITKDVKNWEFQEITCKDISDLMYLSEKIGKKTKSDMQQTIQFNLKQLFERSIKGYNLLPEFRNGQKLQNEVFGSLQQITKKIIQIQKKAEMLKKNDINLDFNELTILLNFRKSNPNLIDGQGNFSSYFKKDDDEQHSSQLAALLDTFSQYLKECKNQIVRLQDTQRVRNLKLNDQTEDEDFQDFKMYLFEKLLSIGKSTEIRGNLKQIQIVSDYYQKISEQQILGKVDSLNMQKDRMRIQHIG